MDFESEISKYYIKYLRTLLVYMNKYNMGKELKGHLVLKYYNNKTVSGEMPDKIL
jgi:hypothetical protein